jgi:hypothetical protein
MKISDLRRIIQEELSSILSENAPAKEPETPGTKEKEKNPVKPDKTRKWTPKPGAEPKPKAKKDLNETEKELVNKITQRFLKSKK